MDAEPIKSHTKTKNPLTLFALVIIILILGIIFNKNFHQDAENPDFSEEGINDFIAPELQLQNVKNTNLDSLDETEDGSEANTQETAELAEMKSLIAQKAKTPLDRMQVIEMPIPRTQKTATPEAKPQVQKPVKEEVVETIDESKKEVKKVEKIKAPVKPKEDKKVQEVREVREVKEVKPKPIVEKPVQQNTQRTNGKTYYIQVGAFKNDPSKRLLSVITSTGFKYRITEPNRSGAKKLLIGPYHNKASVNKALAKVHTRINKSAYIIQK
jgi:DedD protein